MQKQKGIFIEKNGKCRCYSSMSLTRSQWLWYYYGDLVNNYKGRHFTKPLIHTCPNLDMPSYPFKNFSWTIRKKGFFTKLLLHYITLKFFPTTYPNHILKIHKSLHNNNGLIFIFVKNNEQLAWSLLIKLKYYLNAICLSLFQFEKL